MRLVDMDPREPGFLLPSNPIDRGRNRRRTGPLRLAERTPLGPFAVPVVVDIEAAREAEADVERKRAHERARPVALRLEHGRQRRELGWNAEARVLPHAVGKGIL